MEFVRVAAREVRFIGRIALPQRPRQANLQVLELSRLSIVSCCDELRAGCRLTDLAEASFLAAGLELLIAPITQLRAT